ncbi:MAG: hypothetical protein JSV21_11095 [Nitrospirota bacterium]|nr:MAG: hypothetical protein JSV21_11095 [Nitrospirota bacterium]
MEKKLVLIILLFSLVIITSLSFALPIEINYQGYLTDQSGVPVDGAVTMTFRLYDDPLAGALQWDSTPVSVDVSGGVYSVVLGETPQPAIIPAIFANQLWLSIEVETDGEMAPRQKLTATSYSIQAGTAENVGWANISGVPAGFSDNTDNDTTYSAGEGLNLVGTTFQVSKPLDLAEAVRGAMIRGENRDASLKSSGISGIASASTGGTFGVYGENSSDSGFGLFGYATALTGSATGVYGESTSATGIGIYGAASSNEGVNYGVWGTSGSAEGFGVYGANTGGGYAGFFDGDLSVRGMITGSGSGLSGLNASSLSSGTVPNLRLSGTYSNVINLTNASNAITGTISGDGSGLTNVNSDTVGGYTVEQISNLAQTQIPRTNAISALPASGEHLSMTIGVDGLPVISSYVAGLLSDLQVTKCLDPACLSTTVNTIASPWQAGRFSSIAIGADGLPIISYQDYWVTDSDCMFAKCLDKNCSSASISTIGPGGHHTSITAGTDGLPVISYVMYTVVHVAKCNDSSCTSVTNTWIEEGGYTSIAIGLDGLPIIAYNGGSIDLKIAKCLDNACSTFSITTLDSLGDVGAYSSLTIGADGLPIISYRDITNSSLKVAKCSDVACSSAAITTLDANGDVGYFTSITIGTDGLPIISYRDNTNGDLKVAKCSDSACSSAYITTIDTTGSNLSQFTSISIGTDGLPIIAYEGNGGLKVVRCANAFCLNNWSRR